MASRHAPFALQVAAVLLLVLGIAGLLWSQRGGSPAAVSNRDRPAVAEGQIARRSDPPHRPDAPGPVADPHRIQATLEVGRTYRIQAKGGFVAPATHVDPRGHRRTVNLAHAFETAFSRTIEQNDGRRVVELRRFGRIWAVTLLSAEDLTLELGPPGEPLLEPLRGAEPHEGTRCVVPSGVARAILRNGVQAVVEDPTAQAFWYSDSLSDKTVRLTYVDGVGVESIQPVGCTLTGGDSDFLFLSPLLWHGYVLSNTGSGPGDSWPVDAAQLMDFLPPSMRSIPNDRILVKRNQDAANNHRHRVDLQISGAAGERPDGAAFSPTGTLQFDPGDGPAATATLRWRASRDCLTQLYPPFEHVLPRVELREEPTISLRYRCDVRPKAVDPAPHEDREITLVSTAGGLRSVGGGPTGDGSEPPSIIASARPRRFLGPPPDVIAGILVLLASSVVLFWWGRTIARDLPARLSRCVLLGTVALIVLFAAGVHGTLLLAQMLPFSNAIVLGNWLPPGAALLAGIVAGERAVPAWRRAAFGLILLALGWYTVLGAPPAPPPKSRTCFQNGVSLQTSSVSCGPCCAVTLLEYHGIEASEREMMDLCLTNRSGTSLLGLYRGLKLKTRHTDWDVEVVRCRVEDLYRAETRPLIVSVRLEREPPAGWTEWSPSPLTLVPTGHTIVLLGIRDDGRVEVGDPSCGDTQWYLDDLRARWNGEGLRLAARRGPPWLWQDLPTLPLSTTGRL